MLREIRDLGFEYAELSHGVRVSLVPGIIDAVEAGVIKISTLHNFCPLPPGFTQAAPNAFDLVLRYFPEEVGAPAPAALGGASS
jgi:hypothetical protein